MNNDPSVLAYLAGLFDGEGCVGVYDTGRQMSVIVVVAMTTTLGPTLFSSTFGGNVRAVRRDPRCEQWKQVHIWRVSAQKAGNVLRSLLPYLREKREQAELALQVLDAQRGRCGKWQDAQTRGMIRSNADRIRALKQKAS